jgi:hypothetical protein
MIQSMSKANPHWKLFGGAGAACAFLIALLVAPLVSAPAWSADSYGGIFPLGERTPSAKFPEEPIPFKTLKDIPARPGLALEIGDPFLDTGKLGAGFETPWGAVWQPRLWGYMIYRTAFQHFQTATRTNNEWANRLDVFVNLQLTGTEKILLNLRPLDRNRPGQFTRYSFDDPRGGEGFVNELNTDIEALFFEGDLGSLFPKLDPEGIIPLDFGYTVGRQAITFQEGMLINDTVNMVGLVRNNLYLPGVSSLRLSGMWAWDRADRGVSQADTNTFALFSSADLPKSTINLDLIYIEEKGRDGDAFYVGASAIQRIGLLNTAFRINNSIALGKGRPGVRDGSLLSAEVSWTPHNSDDIVYVNPYLTLGNFTQAGREAVVGGPLGVLGILFASPSLSNYGSELTSFTDDVAGFAAGYQAFWDNHRRNLVLEVATRKDTGDGGRDSLALGFQLQQALGRHFQVQVEGFYSFIENSDNSNGARVELQIVY